MVDAVAISANNIYIRQSGKIAFLLNENIDICKTIKLLGGLNMQFLSTIWIFIQDQILGMKWLSSLIGEFLYSIGLDTSGKIGGSVQFFIYDVIKIVFLLCMLIFIISYIQSFFPPERTKRILGTFHGIGANVLAALLGISYSLLFLFFHSFFYWIYKCRIIIRSYIQFSYFISNGRHWFVGIIDEYLWNESGSGLCVARSCDCSCRRNTYRKTSP